MKPKNHTHWLEKPNFHNRSVSDLRGKNSTSPQPSPKERGQFPSFGGVRGGESVRKQLPSPLNPPQGEFWRGLGGGVTRNDVKRTSRRAMPHANDARLSAFCITFFRHCGRTVRLRSLSGITTVSERSRRHPQSPAKRHRHSEQSEESVAKFRGLPRRSYLTARNDGAGEHHLFQSFELWKRLVKNLANLENLNKIVVQTKKINNKIKK